MGWGDHSDGHDRSSFPGVRTVGALDRPTSVGFASSGCRARVGRVRFPPRSLPRPREGRTIRLLSLASRDYLDDADPGAAAHRAFVAGLAGAGIAVEVLTGSTLAAGPEGDPSARLAARGRVASGAALAPPGGIIPATWPYPPSHLRTEVDGHPVHLLRGPSTLPHEPDDDEVAAFLSILDHLLDTARPDALLAHGADRLAADALRRGRSRGLPTALRLRHRGPHDPRAIAADDALLAPSRALADELRESTGRPCTALPDFVDPARVRTDAGDRKYLVFVNPTPANGLPAFARIADELGQRRPDIPLLAVAGPDGREHLDRCGLDLKAHGNVDLMKPPSDPRAVWARAKVALAPALDGSCPPAAAIEAIINGLPVVASDRGALPEVLGSSGVALPLPDRVTPATRILPTAEEVVPWVAAIARLWDDPDHYAEHRRRALAEARRWESRPLAALYSETFRDLRPLTSPTVPPPGRAKAIVLVPHLNGIEPECEDGLRGLERLGVRVARRRGSSQIDIARNEMASDALHDGFESVLFIDADTGFDPLDALRLLARPEPVVSGVYAKKARRQMACTFAPGVVEVLFGPESPGPYPLEYAATGFLRIRADVLRRMIAELGLPLCNRDWGRGSWPFFLPLVVDRTTGNPHYLGEDWAFSYRLRQVGITPLADASIRLWHHGTYPYGWEDAGEDRPRHGSYRFRPLQP